MCVQNSEFFIHSSILLIVEFSYNVRYTRIRLPGGEKSLMVSGAYSDTDDECDGKTDRRTNSIATVYTVSG